MKISRQDKTNHSNTTKPALILLGLVVVLAIFALSIGAIYQIREDARQSQLQNEAREKTEQEKVLKAQNQKMDYDKCIEAGNTLYTNSLGKLPRDLYGTERFQAIQLISDTVESFKKDCDREYGK